jgi:DNA-binding NarL/FixJ family response regulator
VDITWWVVLQMMISLMLVGVVWAMVRHVKTVLWKEVSRDVVRQILGKLEPLLDASRSTAMAFERQLEEKRQLIADLNQTIDSRIAKLTLLLNRADIRLSEDFQGAMPSRTDRQPDVWKLFRQGLDAEAIANQLSIPRGEVELMIDLKKKALKSS